MVGSFVDVLKREISSLQAELGEDPRFVRLQRLLLVLETYVDDDDAIEDAFETAPIASTAPAQEHRRATPSRSRAERTQAILDMATAIIRGRNAPTPTANIFEELKRRGVHVHGQKPMNNLSAILSYSGLFEAHGRSGWTMRKVDDVGKNTEAVDDPNLPGRASTASEDHRPADGGTTSKHVEPAQGGGI
ncbi:hypothetical protein [Hyphomicrobium sulfonivorans]|uniref:hypothetical protein n=1 Tax=Hyphomicrobium sulfonivorans TaxID=121290 RepID=UPI0008390982|nr:hypothetical protein [Hyphomicrobium sulfonivorans]